MTKPERARRVAQSFAAAGGPSAAADAACNRFMAKDFTGELASLPAIMTISMPPPLISE
jgi:hypothetical protein